MHVESLALPVKKMKPKSLAPVEPEHPAVHRFAPVEEDGRLAIRSHARLWHIGQGGSAPLMLIPYPQAMHRYSRDTSLTLRADAAHLLSSLNG